MNAKQEAIRGMSYGRFKVHPVLAAFPLMDEEALDELTADIGKHGLQEPIVLAPDDETIVDGRNRFLACVRSGMDPSYITLGPHYDEEGVLPLFPKAKEHPPAGFTSHKGVWPFSTEIYEWIEGRPYGNICLRLPENGLGIDVDAYGGKKGAENLARLEAKYGKLPKTMVSTSRGDGISGIKLYRVPARPGWRGEADKAIEVVQFSHRYIIVSLSIHLETGRVYRWVNERTGEMLDHSPRLEDLAALPQAWVVFLSSDTPGPDKADVTDEEAYRWFTWLPRGTRCPPVAETIIEFHEPLKSGFCHDAGLNCVMGLTRFGALGHRDVRNAMIEARTAFLNAVMADGHGKRVKREAAAEWARMAVGAYSVIKADLAVERWRKCLCLSDRSLVRVTVKSVRGRATAFGWWCRERATH